MAKQTIAIAYPDADVSELYADVLSADAELADYKVVQIPVSRKTTPEEVADQIRSADPSAVLMAFSFVYGVKDGARRIYSTNDHGDQKGLTVLEEVTQDSGEFTSVGAADGIDEACANISGPPFIMLGANPNSKEYCGETPFRHTAAIDNKELVNLVKKQIARYVN
jgi:hypothetical protein